MSEVPLKPLGKEDIRKLEVALILQTLFREDVIKQALEARDKVTWLDSLLVAAAALARERAGYPVSRIAEELGRSEATIRNHLQGKTEAGKIVRETYQELVKRGGVLEIQLPKITGEEGERARQLEEELNKLKEKIEKAKEKIKEALSELE